MVQVEAEAAEHVGDHVAHRVERADIGRVQEGQPLAAVARGLDGAARGVEAARRGHVPHACVACERRARREEPDGRVPAGAVRAGDGQHHVRLVERGPDGAAEGRIVERRDQVVHPQRGEGAELLQLLDGHLPVAREERHQVEGRLLPPIHLAGLERGGVAHAAREQPGEHRRAVRRRAAARVVGGLRHHGGAAHGGRRGVDGLVRRVVALPRGLAQRPDARAPAFGRGRGHGQVAVGDGQHLRAHMRHVAIGEPVREGEREEAAARRLLRQHVGDERAHRLARGVPHVDHPQVAQRQHRPHLAPRRALGEREQVARAVGHVGVRVFLVGHDKIGHADEPLVDVAVQVELDADDV